jgi:ribonuclease inhibitor
MAWRVAVVFDDETDLGSLIGWLPIWAWLTTNHLAVAPQLRAGWSSLWGPEPALTLINIPIGDDPIAALVGVVPAIKEHHPRLTTLHLFGLEHSIALQEALLLLDYEYKCERDTQGLIYSQPMTRIGDVKEISLDARGWVASDDVYDAFFEAIGAPDWHGRNFDALIDSIETGGVNKIEVPYRIVIRNSDHAKHEAAELLSQFADLINEMAERGCPVGIQIK